ncbi:MAG: hypothetical protein H0V14_10295 [Chitinophagaceae bacterium]|nr:hypothetical protein [Chitinophagaceae bacterium]
MNVLFFEKIEEYLRGKMNREDQLRFEAEMAVNEELASAYNIYRGIENEMREMENDNNDDNDNQNKAGLRESLEKLNAIYFKKEITVEPVKRQTVRSDARIRRIKIWKTAGIAAAVISVVALSIPLILRENDSPKVVINENNADTPKKIQAPNIIINKENISSENITKKDNSAPKANKKMRVLQLSEARRNELYAANFKLDKIPGEQEGLYAEAFENLTMGEYKDAIEAFKNPIPTRGLESDSMLTAFYGNYYLALSYLADSNAAKAVPELKKAISGSPDMLSQIKSQWYLALAYLKTGNVKNAKEFLTRIAVNKEETKYKTQAQALLKKLKGY